VFSRQLLDLGFEPIALHIEYDERMLEIGQEIVQQLAGEQRVVDAAQGTVIVPHVYLNATVIRHGAELFHRVNSVFNQ
jgi:hypothetical protein